MRISTVLLCLVGVFIGSALGCASAPSPTDNPELRRLLGDYRTWAAAQTELGAYGRKLRHKRNFFFHLGTPKYVGLETRAAVAATVTQADQKKLKNAGINLEKVASVTGRADNETTQNFKIIVVRLLIDPLTTQLGELAVADQQILYSLSDVDARVVTSVAIVTDYQMEQKLSRGGELDATLSVEGQKIGLDVKLESGMQTKIILDDQAIVGYQISRLCWDSTGKLRTLNLDQEGSDHCPEGTSPKRPSPLRPSVRPSQSG